MHPAVTLQARCPGPPQARDRISTCQSTLLTRVSLRVSVRVSISHRWLSLSTVKYYLWLTCFSSFQPLLDASIHSAIRGILLQEASCSPPQPPHGPCRTVAPSCIHHASGTSTPSWCHPCQSQSQSLTQPQSLQHQQLLQQSLLGDHPCPLWTAASCLQPCQLQPAASSSPAPTLAAEESPAPFFFCFFF